MVTFVSVHQSNLILALTAQPSLDPRVTCCPGEGGPLGVGAEEEGHCLAAGAGTNPSCPALSSAAGLSWVGGA